METYRVKLPSGAETEPASLEEIKKLISEKQLKGTTLVLPMSEGKWHLAATVREIRDLIREFDPSQDQVLDRLSISGAGGETIVAKAKRRAHEKAALPFWKRIF